MDVLYYSDLTGSTDDQMWAEMSKLGVKNRKVSVILVIICLFFRFIVRKSLVARRHFSE